MLVVIVDGLPLLMEEDQMSLLVTVAILDIADREVFTLQ